MPQSRSFLITGALGAIGVWTARSLLARGHRVIAFDLGGDGHRLALALSADQIAAVERVQGDVTDLAQLEAVLAAREIDGVVHLAALQVPFVRENPPLGAAVNVVGTVNVLEAVRRRGGIGPVVYASSVAVYGTAGTLDGGDPPQTLYGAYKRANETTAIRYAEDFGVPSIGLRPHTVYGPARDQGLTSAPTIAMLAAAAGVPYRIPFGGSIQLQYAPDVGEAFARAALLEVDDASVHNLDGEVVATADLPALIDPAVPGREGLITVDATPLPLVAAVDGSSLVALLGGSVMRPAADGVADAVAHFERLLADGLVSAPAAGDS
jgi:UDP-glucuronate 4-epimerase